MNSQPIPAHPVALTAEEATAMEQMEIKKHDNSIILLHWFNAFVWLIELMSGFALIVGAAYRVMPQWYTTMIASALGSRANILRVHIALGLTWIIVFLVYGIFGYRQYFCKQVLINEVELDRDDFQWLRIKLLLILNRTKEALPEQGSYNAGQKMFALLVYSALPVIAITGLIMTFHLFGTATVAWAMLLHFVAVGIVASGLMIHVYMGAVFPEERPAFFSMITGKVNELFAYDHHFKWWRQIKLEEREWQKEFQSTTPSEPESKL